VEDDDAHVAVIAIDEEFCCGVDDTLTEELVDAA
jgi:hypothetical protein